MRTIRVGTRTSALAVKQTELVMNAVRERFPESAFEPIALKTRGDRLPDVPLQEFGGKGAFVTEFEEALLRGEIDIAVHSAKDMPMELAPGLEIWAVLPREDIRDVLVSCKSTSRHRVENGVIGTGSLRRQLQIKALYPVECGLLRGNVPTRIGKLRNGDYDGILLAAAGLRRLGLERETDLRYRYLEPEEMLPAGGQGIIAVEGRAEDPLRGIFSRIGDNRAFTALETERYVLWRLQAGCHEAVGVLAEPEEESIQIRLMVEKEQKPCAGRIRGALADRFALADRLINEVMGVE